MGGLHVIKMLRERCKGHQGAGAWSWGSVALNSTVVV